MEGRQVEGGDPAVDRGGVHAAPVQVEDLKDGGFSTRHDAEGVGSGHELPWELSALVHGGEDAEVETHLGRATVGIVLDEADLAVFRHRDGRDFIVIVEDGAVGVPLESVSGSRCCRESQGATGLDQGVAVQRADFQVFAALLDEGVNARVKIAGLFICAPCGEAAFGHHKGAVELVGKSCSVPEHVRVAQDEAVVVQDRVAHAHGHCRDVLGGDFKSELHQKGLHIFEQGEEQRTTSGVLSQRNRQRIGARISIGAIFEVDEADEVVFLEGEELGVEVVAVFGAGAICVIVACQWVIAARGRCDHGDGGDHAIGRVAADAAVVVVGARHGEGVRAHADAVGIAADGRQGEHLWVAEGFPGNDADVAIDVVEAALIDPGDGLAGVDGQGGGVVVEVSGQDGVVGAIAGGLDEGGCQQEGQQQGGKGSHGKGLMQTS